MKVYRRFVPALIPMLATLLTACENPLRGPDLLTISNETDQEVVVLLIVGDRVNRVPVTTDSAGETTVSKCFAADIAVETTDGQTIATLDDQQICPRWILIVNPDHTLTYRDITT